MCTFRYCTYSDILINIHQGGIFLLPGCCDPFNEKALRASRGASFQLPIVSGCCEGRGLSEKSQQECELVSIPMAGEFESLNVSAAGGIFLYMLQPKN
ncbi:hypothetical protein CRYUN_Cryun17cG0102400 [Craigia yunnanensis]